MLSSAPESSPDSFFDASEGLESERPPQTLPVDIPKLDLSRTQPGKRAGTPSWGSWDEQETKFEDASSAGFGWDDAAQGTAAEAADASDIDGANSKHASEWVWRGMMIQGGQRCRIQEMPTTGSSTRQVQRRSMLLLMQKLLELVLMRAHSRALLLLAEGASVMEASPTTMSTGPGITQVRCTSQVLEPVGSVQHFLLELHQFLFSA